MTFLAARSIRFVRPLPDVTHVTERGEVMFEVELSHKDVDIVWYKNGAKMARTKNVEITCDGSSHRMVLRQVTMEDYGVEVMVHAEGEYTYTRLIVDGKMHV